MYNAYSDEGNRSSMLRSGIWEESKNPKSCLKAKRRAGQLAYAQTIPAHRLTTPLRILRSSDRFLQRRMSLLPLPQKVCSNRSLRFLDYTIRKCYCLNRLINVEVARLVGFRYEKSSDRALLLEAIYSLTSVLKSSENRPISTKILRGWRMARGAFGRGLVKLKVPDTDIRAGGALV